MFSMFHIQYIQGLRQSGPSTADYALFLVAFAERERGLGTSSLENPPCRLCSKGAARILLT
jgi:hypothetical protein